MTRLFSIVVALFVMHTCYDIMHDTFDDVASSYANAIASRN